MHRGQATTATKGERIIITEVYENNNNIFIYIVTSVPKSSLKVCKIKHKWINCNLK